MVLNIITEKENKIIRDIGNVTDKDSYWLINQTRYSKLYFDLYENIEVSDKIIPFKYCYTSKQGFYENPNWSEPDTSNTFNIPDDVYMAIKEQAIQEVQNELNK